MLIIINAVPEQEAMKMFGKKLVVIMIAGIASMALPTVSK
jgi:hypothetical protein